jgi:hypothetical protein
MQSLLGSWKLVALYRKKETGERVTYMGERPSGRITYTEDGRMHAIVVADSRPRPEARPSESDKARLFETTVAYSGTYRVEGATVTHSVDVSWNEQWTGHDQVRYFDLAGDQLTISTGPIPDPVDGETSTYIIEWRRDV